MKIENVEVFRLALPYKKPLVTATTRFVKAEGLVVKVCCNTGLTGYGYSELFNRTGETQASAHYAIEKVIKPIILGSDLRDLASLRMRIDHILIGNLRAKAGLDTALYDLLSKAAGNPLYLQFGGLVRKEVRVARMIGLDEPEAMAGEARALTEEGFTALKLKIAGDLDLDSKRVSKVRHAVGDRVFIKVDANEAYDAKTAIQLAKKLADLGVEIFEQPVPRSQLEALCEVRRHSPVKIEADQSVVSAADALRLVSDRAVDSINTSIQKAGGFVEARRIAELCAITGIHCVLGNTAGSVVGDAAALHLALSSMSASLPCEIGEFECVSGDPFTSLEVRDGVLKAPDKDGLGIELKGELE